MANFLSEFQSFFSAEERESELYRILAAIGVDVEKAVYEEINSEIRQSTEALAFSDQKLHSWLASFLVPVRNVVSARGIGRMDIDYADQSFGVSKGSIINGKNGKLYELQDDLTFSGYGDSLPISFIQGVSTQASQKYSEFMSLNAPGVDISSVEVFLEDVPIPQAIPYPSFSGISDAVSFVEDLKAVKLAEPPPGNEELLEKLDEVLFKLRACQGSVGVLWDALRGVSVRPSNGFYPYFYNDTLYIKIYPGVDVPVPVNQTATIKYRTSDGSAGNIEKDSFSEFSSVIKTASTEPVKYTLYNDAVVNGVDPPSHAELVNLLRKRFFASTHVSSVPEYTAWFMAQPGVGDCLVMSDYDRWRLSGRLDFSGFNLTGVVSIYLLRDNGKIVNPNIKGNVPEVQADYDFVNGLDRELEKVRDIAFPSYEKPTIYWHYYVIQFRSSFDDAAFITAANSSLNEVYNVTWVKNNSTSLFKDLDLESLNKKIRNSQDPVGLRIIPYHYFEMPYNMSGITDSKLTFPYYFGEKAGGWYEFWEFDGTGFGDEPVAIFREFPGVSGDCTIYQYKKKYQYVNGNQAGWVWSELIGPVGSSGVGSRYPVSGDPSTSGVIEFKVPSSLVKGVLRCFWAVDKEGLMPVGSDLSKNFGVRKLPVKYGGDLTEKPDDFTYFGDGVRFEKYI